MNKRRLRKLRDHLRKLDKQAVSKRDREFDMDDWFSSYMEEAEDIQDKIVALERDPYASKNGTQTVCVEVTCHTSACALGEACMIPEFKRAGLKLDDTPSCTTGLLPTFKGETGVGAGALFFGISVDQSSYLFMPSWYSIQNIKPRHVADRIQRILDGKIPEEQTDDNRRAWR